MSSIIDFHSHILPNIDDGSSSLQESVSMLKMEAEQGIRHVIATPHFYAQRDNPERFLARRRTAEACLREEMEKHSGLPQLSVGAEVLYFPGISYSDALPSLTIAGGKYILIEMPNSPWIDAMYRELEGIYVRQGLTPIVAHVDRYIRPFKSYGIPERLEQLPLLVQANANFFLRGTTKRMALKMLRKNQIHLLGSDSHNLSSRAPNLGDAVDVINRRMGKEKIEQIIFYQNQILFD